MDAIEEAMMKKIIASPWRRLVAIFIDTVLFLFISNVVLFVVYPVTGNQTILHLLPLVLWMAYAVLPTYLWGATLGKLALGLRVVKDDGSRLDLADALIREYTGKAFSSLVFGLGYLWSFFHPHHKCWHDLMADTIVIHLVPESPKALETCHLGWNLSYGAPRWAH